MEILIRHVASSSLAGLETRHAGTMFRVGYSESCEIRFNREHDPAVCAEHLQINIESGIINVTGLDPTAVILVNGDPIAASVVVEPDDIITLGQNGPQLQIILVQDTASAKSTKPMTSQRGPATIKGRRHSESPLKPPVSGILPTVKGVRKDPGSFKPGELPPVRIGGGNRSVPAPDKVGKTPVVPAPLPHPSRKKTRSASAPKRHHGRKHRPSERSALTLLESRENKEHVGVNTLVRIVRAATSRERKRSTRLLVAFFLCTVALGIAGLFYFSDSSEITPDFPALFSQIRPSVCVVFKRMGGDPKTDRAFGTAWSVAPGFFATNAHVAGELKDNENLDFYVRSIGDSPRDLHVTGYEIHPGYDQFMKLLMRYRPYDHNKNDFHSFPLACDVGILKISADDKKMQPPCLEVAESTEQVLIGSSIGSVGFPMEGVFFNIQQPASETRIGSVIKTTNAWIGDITSDEAELFHYQFESAGGASGSPVFDTSGCVIGLLSGGNVVGFSQSGPRYTVGGTTFGPSVVLLNELMRGNATKVQQNRTKTWEKWLLKVFQDGTSDPQRFVRAILGRLVAHPPLKLRDKKLTEVSNHATVLSIKTGGERGVFNNVNLPKKGDYLLIVTCINRPAAIRAYADTGRAQVPVSADNEDKTYFDVVSLSASRSQSVRVIVESISNEEAGDVKLSLWVYYIAEK